MKSFIAKFLLPLFAFALLLGSIGVQAADAGLNPLLVVPTVGAVLIVLSFIPTAAVTAYRQGIDVAMWVNYVTEKLYANNSFIQAAYSDDEFVKEGKYVILPQAGSDPKVTKNREVFPAPISRRADSTLNYMLNAYRTDPTHITAAETYEASYNKMDSVLGGHINALTNEVAIDLIVMWGTELPQANIVLTTGANTSLLSNVQTGARKVFRYQDLKLAQRKMNEDDVPENDRFCVITANHLDELVNSFSDNQYALFSQGYNAATGSIGALFGFTFYQRSSVATMTVAGGDVIVKPYGAAKEAADRDATVCFQKDAVTKALGTVDVFEDLRVASMYGDIYSAELYMGGRRRRADNKGVYFITSALGV